MKKVLLSVLAVGMLTACSQDETVDMQAPSQIAFTGAFVNNVTRAADPSTTTDNIKTFDVWGYVTNSTGTVFNDVTVTKSGNAWTYETPQYWTPNKDYRFFALTPDVNVTKAGLNDPYTNGLGKITFKNLDGSQDLLYASATAHTEESLEGVAPVNFVFDHLLSKVKFTFKNGFATKYSTIEVTNVRMAVPAQGSITLNEQPAEDNKVVYTWSEQSGNLKLNFGNITGNKTVAEETTIGIAEGAAFESDKERLTIPAPATQSYEVTFDIKLFQDQVLAHTATQTATIANVELKAGYAYNFVASIDASNLDGGLEPIKFTAVVEDWVQPNEVGFIGVGGEIKNNMTLGTDVTATSMVTLADGVTFDGNGYTMSIKEGDKTFYEEQTLRLIKTTGDATIKNLTIEGNNTKYAYDGDSKKEGIENYGIRGIFMTGDGDVTIDNVTIQNVTYTINTGSGKQNVTVTNSNLEGWTSYGASTSVTFEEVNFTTNPDAASYLRPQGVTIMKNCTFDADYRFSLDLLQKEMKLIDCTWNGQPITAENIQDMIDTAYYSGKPADTNLDKVSFTE